MTDVIETNETTEEAIPEERVARPMLEAHNADLRLAAVGILRANEAEVTNGLVGLVLAQDEVELERAGARLVVAGGPVEISQGGAGMILSAGNVSITQGGGGTVASLGDVTVEQGGAALVVSRSARLGAGSFVGVALTPRLEVESGARVLIGGREAAALGGVVLFAVFASVVRSIFRRGAAAAKS